MSKDVEAIFNQLSRLDAMAKVAGNRIDAQAAITKQMVQLMTVLRKTSNCRSNYFKLDHQYEKSQKIAIAALVFAVAAFAVALFK